SDVCSSDLSLAFRSSSSPRAWLIGPCSISFCPASSSLRSFARSWRICATLRSVTTTVSVAISSPQRLGVRVPSPRVPSDGEATELEGQHLAADRRHLVLARESVRLGGRRSATIGRVRGLAARQECVDVVAERL